MDRPGTAQAKKRSLLRDTEGSATAEAVIMIPFFVIVWGCIIWASSSYERALDVGATTREHGWAHVMNACNGSTPGGTDVTDATRPVLGPLGAVLGMVEEIIGLVPFVGDYFPGFFPEERQFVRDDTVERPRAAGGGNTRVGHTIVLMCNEDLETPSLEEGSNEAWGIFGGGL